MENFNRQIEIIRMHNMKEQKQSLENEMQTRMEDEQTIEVDL